MVVSSPQLDPMTSGLILEEEEYRSVIPRFVHWSLVVRKPVNGVVWNGDWYGVVDCFNCLLTVPTWCEFCGSFCYPKS